jgi:hypothetical protein
VSCNETATHLKECYPIDMPFKELPDTLQTIFLAKIPTQDIYVPLNLDSPQVKMVYRTTIKSTGGFYPGKIYFLINDREYFLSASDTGFNCPFVLYQGCLYSPCKQNLFTEGEIKEAKFRKIILSE